MDRRYVDCIVSGRTPSNCRTTVDVIVSTSHWSSKFLVCIMGCWHSESQKKNDQPRSARVHSINAHGFLPKGTWDRWRNDSDALSFLYHFRGSLVSPHWLAATTSCIWYMVFLLEMYVKYLYYAGCLRNYLPQTKFDVPVHVSSML